MEAKRDHLGKPERIWVRALGFRVLGLEGFRVLGFKGLGFGVQGLGPRTPGTADRGVCDMQKHFPHSFLERRFFVSARSNLCL